MSRLSEGRISHLAHLIMDRLSNEGLAEFPNNINMLREAKDVLSEFDKEEERIDQAVRKKIHSLSRPVPPGSPEWQVLYRKYLEEELRKR